MSRLFLANFLIESSLLLDLFAPSSLLFPSSPQLPVHMFILVATTTCALPSLLIYLTKPARATTIPTAVGVFAYHILCVLYMGWTVGSGGDTMGPVIPGLDVGAQRVARGVAGACVHGGMAVAFGRYLMGGKGRKRE